MFARVSRNIVSKTLTRGAGLLRTSRMSQVLVTSQKTRCFSSTSTLGEILGAEIQEESANDMVNEEFMEVKGNIEKKFTVSEEEGSGVVTLKSSRRGEDICITFDCQDEVEDQQEDFNPEDFDENDEEQADNMNFGINFKVVVNKKNSTDSVVFFCVAGEGVRVENVQHLSQGQSDDDHANYSGPEFNKLSEELQDALVGYLADREIDDDLAFFIISCSENKEQREYVRWLNKLKEFTEAK